MNLIPLSESIQIDIDSPVNQGHSTQHLLHRIIALLHHQQKQIEWIKRNMITPESLNVTTLALRTAVTGAIALFTNPGASTPDSTVTAFQNDIQAEITRLNTAEGTVVTPPPAADWQPNTAYAAGALVRNPADGLTYSSNAAQTSGTVFDPALWTVATVLRARR